MATPVDLIRNVMREDGKQERRDHRDHLLDKNRGALGEITEKFRDITDPRDVTELANRLKHKGHVSVQELTVLKHAFINSEDNIAAFLKVNGALHALVRELSGLDTQFQLAAVNCCCNLALGNEKLCVQLTKSAAPYLISSLDGLNNTFLDACVWTIGNLAGSGPKSWNILKSQGAMPKLIHLLTSFNDDVKHSAIYALTYYVKTGFNYLEPKEFELIASEVYPLLVKESSVFWLVYLLSCSSECNSIFLKNSVFTQVFELLTKEINSKVETKPVKTTALLRILANLCGEQTGEGIQEFVCIQDTKPEALQSVLNVLLTSPYAHIQNEVLWLLGNVLKHYSEIPQADSLLAMVQPNLN